MEAVRQEAWRRIGVTPPPPLENPDDVTLEAHCRDVLRLLRSFRDRRGGVL
jgi:hypothetical protein